MNSRGTLISHRTSGDTLANSETVAMMPTVQPAAAGTQRYRERDLLRGPERDPERGSGRGEVSVTDREDMPSIREKLGEALRAASTRLCLPDSEYHVSNRGPAAEVLKATSRLLN